MLSFLEIGSKISIARKIKNLSQAQLAEGLSVSAQAVGKWERGESMPDIVTFGKLAEILEVELNYFSNDQEPLVSLPATVIEEQKSEENQKPDWNMSGGNWKDADFSGLSGLAEKFSGANVENCKFLRAELSGLQLRGNNLKKSDFSSSDLSKSIFRGSNLEHNNFTGCSFEKSEFKRTNIKDCDFSNVNMKGFVSRWSNFNKVHFIDAIFDCTVFQYSQLSNLSFSGEIVDCAFENCDYHKVEFNGVTIRNTFFKNCKLKKAKFIACKADKQSYAFMKACKAELLDVEIIV